MIIEGAGQRQTVTTDDFGQLLGHAAAGSLYGYGDQGRFSKRLSSDIAVASDQAVSADISLTTASSNNLDVIGRTTGQTSGNGAKFNISSSTINTLTQAQILIRNTPDLTQVVNELPGITIPHATTNPNQSFIIRGLRYESKTTLDGHPVSSGTGGTFLTNYASAPIFSGVDVYKGGGFERPDLRRSRRRHR